MTETENTLLSRVQAGDLYDTPPLATCSYREYQRGMGTATAITRGSLRGVSLPDARYTDAAHWPAVKLLRPGSVIFGKGLPPEEFRDRYLDQLNAVGGKVIAAALRQVPVEDGRIVLLCFESGDRVAKNPWVCHRRVFADWWQGLTGTEVPELSGAEAPGLFTTP